MLGFSCSLGGKQKMWTHNEGLQFCQEEFFKIQLEKHSTEFKAAKSCYLALYSTLCLLEFITKASLAQIAVTYLIFISTWSIKSFSQTIVAEGGRRSLGPWSVGEPANASVESVSSRFSRLHICLLNSAPYGTDWSKLNILAVPFYLIFLKEHRLPSSAQYFKILNRLIHYFLFSISPFPSDSLP